MPYYWIVPILFISFGVVLTVNSSSHRRIYDIVNLIHKVFQTTTPAPPNKEIEKDNNFLNYSWSNIWCMQQPNGAKCSPSEILYRHQFYYDIEMQACSTFRYGQCEEHVNHFEHLQTCSEKCIITFTQPKQPLLASLPARVYCQLQPQFGDCSQYNPMFYFDISARKCVGFSYSGCGGNPNRFSSRSDCEAMCSGILHYYYIPEKPNILTL